MCICNKPWVLFSEPEVSRDGTVVVAVCEVTCISRILDIERIQEWLGNGVYVDVLMKKGAFVYKMEHKGNKHSLN